MLDYVLAIRAVEIGETVHVPPYIQLGEESSLASAHAKRVADETVSLPNGETLTTRVFNVDFNNGSRRIFRLSSQPPYKIEADTSLRWQLRSDGREEVSGCG